MTQHLPLLAAVTAALTSFTLLEISNIKERKKERNKEREKRKKERKVRKKQRNKETKKGRKRKKIKSASYETICRIKMCNEIKQILFL